MRKNDYRARAHPACWAFLVHRLAGLGLAFFLPVHFWVLGRAIGGQASLDDFLRVADRPLFRFGEWGLVTGGVHGANRLGGNGVANSTVFGGIAGDSMATWVKSQGQYREPDREAIDAAIRDAELPFSRNGNGLETIRESLYECMWQDVGIIRARSGLVKAREILRKLYADLMLTGVADGDRAFNAQWHDWLNLKNLISVSQIITEAAISRENSRGAHFREDFQDTGAMDKSAYTTIRLCDGVPRIAQERVIFTHVLPGETIL